MPERALARACAQRRCSSTTPSHARARLEHGRVTRTRRTERFDLQKRLRDRNSPTCTLSQNGYGEGVPARLRVAIRKTGCLAALFKAVGSNTAARCQARQHWRASVDGATQHPVLPRSTPACAPSQVDSLNGIPQCALSTPRKYTALCVPSSRALWRARFRWRSRRCVACAPGNGKSPSHARVVRFRRTAPRVRRHHAQPPLGLALASGPPLHQTTTSERRKPCCLGTRAMHGRSGDTPAGHVRRQRQCNIPPPGLEPGSLG